jgi:hypothetical protein
MVRIKSESDLIEYGVFFECFEKLCNVEFNRDVIEDFSIITKRVKSGDSEVILILLVGGCIIEHYTDCILVTHIVIDEPFRGLGYGGEIIEYLKEFGKSIIFEVGDVTFFDKVGAYSYDIDYIQPDLGGGEVYGLKLYGLGERLSDERLNNFLIELKNGIKKYECWKEG